MGVFMKIGRNDPCPCGSGKKYKKCCINMGAQTFDNSSSDFNQRLKDMCLLSMEDVKQKYGDIFKPEGEMKKIFGEINKITYQKINIPCLHPNRDECSPGPIKAHSLPKSLLSKLSGSTNHVAMFGGSMSLFDPPEITIKRVGIKKATIFTGLCAFHDNKIFKLIDTVPPEKFDDEYQFLLCYRAILKEYCAKLYQYEVAEKQFNLENNESPKGVDSFIGQYTYSCYLGLHYSTVMRKIFDKILNTKKFYEELEYGVREINKFVPIAVSSVFTPIRDRNNVVINDLLSGMPNYVFLTVIPSDKKTYVFYATLKRQTEKLQSYIQPFKMLSEESLTNYLSEAILRDIENFVMSYSYWESFSDLKQKEIQKFFHETIIDKKVLYNSSVHNLFTNN